jgi:hypothetical protein
VDARIAELKEAWKGKDGGAIANDKLQRARQKVKPAWVSRTAFRIDDGARKLYLGVGSAPVPANALKAPFDLQESLPGSKAATALDWYLDEAAGKLYALTVEERK